MNALSQPVRQGLQQAFQAADADPEVQAVALVCEGNTFIAGADIKEFGKPPQAPSLPDVIDSIENSRKPSVAVIHGTAWAVVWKSRWVVTTALRARTPRSACPK